MTYHSLLLESVSKFDHQVTTFLGPISQSSLRFQLISLIFMYWNVLDKLFGPVSSFPLIGQCHGYADSIRLITPTPTDDLN